MKNGSMAVNLKTSTRRSLRDARMACLRFVKRSRTIRFGKSRRMSKPSAANYEKTLSRDVQMISIHTIQKNDQNERSPKTQAVYLHLRNIREKQLATIGSCSCHKFGDDLADCLRWRRSFGG